MLKGAANNGLNLAELMSFLHQGANLRARDEEKKTLLHHYLTPEALDYVLQLEVIDPNTQDDDGNTPLHDVVGVKAAQALIQAGANPLKTNNAGQTPREYNGQFNNPLYAGLIVVLRKAENALR